MFLDRFSEYLADQGLGKLGVNIFTHNMPDNVEKGLLVVGQPTGTKVDHEMPKYRRTKFQVIVRHHDQIEGNEMAKKVFDTLNIRNHVFSDVTVRFVYPTNEPIPFPNSKGDMLEYSINFETVFYLTD